MAAGSARKQRTELQFKAISLQTKALTANKDQNLNFPPSFLKFCKFVSIKKKATARIAYALDVAKAHKAYAH
jgi:hypothetical protein